MSTNQPSAPAQAVFVLVCWKTNRSLTSFAGKELK
jgi:hypothetical protein